MAFDSARQRVVLFGGITTPIGGGGQPVADTWEWTGSAWQPQLTLTHPSARAGSIMAYDAARGLMVLAGGSANNIPRSDTWTYSSGQWTQVAGSGTSPSVGYKAAYDPVRQRVVAFGGLSGNTPLTNTWEWDGAAWSQRAVASPPQPRAEYAVCYDPYSRGVLLFGGLSVSPNSVFLNDAYTWDGAAWVARSYFLAPTPRSGHAMALDEVRQRIMVLGGAGFQTPMYLDAWIFPGSIQAEQQLYGSSCGNLSLVTADRPILGQSGRATLSRPQSFGLSYVSVGLSDSAFGPLALPLPLDGYGLPGCWLRQDAALTAHGHCTPTGANSASFSVAIPNVPVLSGLRLYLQGWVPDFTANQGGLVTSNGLRWVLGNF